MASFDALMTAIVTFGIAGLASWLSFELLWPGSSIYTRASVARKAFAVAVALTFLVVLPPLLLRADWSSVRDTVMSYIFGHSTALPIDAPGTQEGEARDWDRATIIKADGSTEHAQPTEGTRVSKKATSHSFAEAKNGELTTLWEWRARKPGEKVWRVLGLKMSEQQAREWGKKNGYEMERVPGSAQQVSRSRGPNE